MTLVYRGENILRGFDDDVRAHLRAEMERRGIRVICKRIVEAVEQVDHGLCVELSDHDDIIVDKVMFATGRRPNIAGLGLEAAGVKLNEKGAIAVDEFSQTSVPHIYAVGDVTDRIALTPVAIREGHAFADTVFGGKPMRSTTPICRPRCSPSPRSASSASPKRRRASNSTRSTSTRRCSAR